MRQVVVLVGVRNGLVIGNLHGWFLTPTHMPSLSITRHHNEQGRLDCGIPCVFMRDPGHESIGWHRAFSAQFNTIMAPSPLFHPTPACVLRTMICLYMAR
jgi:hypothetical protein